jgi:transcription elongation GreA/GreB family factor
LSVAFTKEESAETASETLLPDRPISPHPNLVTQAGLKALETQLRLATDARYFAARVRTAQLVPGPTSADVVAFGSTVTFKRDDGRVQKYRIVGEDEADPKTGSISFVSPVATRLMGRAVGDLVSVGDRDIEIVAIS